MKIAPANKQLDFLNWEFGLFFHFGIRSFYPGHKDWDGVVMSPEGFNPDQLNCEQWIETAKKAGAKYTVLTTKHHDGFALWPSAYTKFSVAHSPWKSGKGDVVREYVDACRKYGMKVGLYYSQAQWDSDPEIRSAGEYDDYFLGQIRELLTNYGKIDYLWFDNAGSDGMTFDTRRIVDEIYRLQPDILTFCEPTWDPDVGWIGNEDGYASLDNRLTVDDRVFRPTECDCQIRRTWFYDHNEDTLKSADELFGMYEMSVGHGSNFLLNIGPDNHGLLPEADVSRLMELSARISAYDRPLNFGGADHAWGDVFTITHRDYDRMTWRNDETIGSLVNRVVLSEDLTFGQSVTSFRLYAHLPTYSNSNILVYQGSTIGHKLICSFGAIRSPQFTLEVTGHDGAYRIRDMKAFFAK